MIISNDWKTLNRNVAALQDRGHVVVFEPTAEHAARESENWDLAVGDGVHEDRPPAERVDNGRQVAVDVEIQLPFIARAARLLGWRAKGCHRFRRRS